METEERVIQKIRSRREAGRAKYGTTMERTDLSRRDWLVHAQEEAMDLAIYLERLLAPGFDGCPNPEMPNPSPVEEVLAEIERATLKFPTWPTDPLHAFAVVGEEHGELQKELLQLTYEPHKSSKANARKEAVQVAAMALRFLMSFDRYEFKPGQEHSQNAGPTHTPNRSPKGMNQNPTQSETADSAQGSGKGLSARRLVLPFFRVILSRPEGERDWRVVANPRWDYFSRAESDILDNKANDYAEHANCGVVYRMIRAKDWLRYAEGYLVPAWTLDPRQNNTQEDRTRAGDDQS